MIGLSWERGSRSVAWDYHGNHTELLVEEVPAAVVAWDEPPSIIVLEPIGKHLDNAIVYDVDGTERLRLVPPYATVRERSWMRGFYTIYVSRGVLTVVYSTNIGEFWGIPDLTTGELTNVSEWR
jgi:hypothetical protein